MAFKRALWHSGLKYRTVCRTCQTHIEYTDYNLDFRPWYPDGFVLCPKCSTPLRHSEMLAVDENGNPIRAAAVGTVPQNVPSDGTFAYCKNCGKKYTIGSGRFCSGCGKELE